jgi:hypothetical protein
MLYIRSFINNINVKNPNPFASKVGASELVGKVKSPHTVAKITVRMYNRA